MAFAGCVNMEENSTPIAEKHEQKIVIIGRKPKESGDGQDIILGLTNRTFKTWEQIESPCVEIWPNFIANMTLEEFRDVSFVFEKQDIAVLWMYVHAAKKWRVCSRIPSPGEHWRDPITIGNRIIISNGSGPTWVYCAAIDMWNKADPEMYGDRGCHDGLYARSGRHSYVEMLNKSIVSIGAARKGEPLRIEAMWSCAAPADLCGRHSFCQLNKKLYYFDERDVYAKSHMGWDILYIGVSSTKLAVSLGDAIIAVDAWDELSMITADQKGKIAVARLGQWKHCSIMCAEAFA